MDEETTAFQKEKRPKKSVKKKEIYVIDVSSDSENSNHQFTDTVANIADKRENYYNYSEKVEADKNAWKGLFGLMQKNQKVALNNIKNNPKKRGLSAPKSKSNSTKKVKIDLEDNKNMEQSNVIKPNPNINTESPQSPEIKVAEIFLKPEDRAALAAKKSVEKLNTCELQSEFLNSLLAANTAENIDDDDPKHFEGNQVKLNDCNISATGKVLQPKSKVCPFYKKLPGTKFSVDAFNYGLIPDIEVYFLSHFHSDHYIGLTKGFSKTIICSRPTGNLVKMKIGVHEDCIRKLQLNKPYIIKGSEVVLVDANHCPGSVMFIIRLPNNGVTYFHTGDFRYTSDMLQNSYILGTKGISHTYLDTTYCDPKYDFPKQVDSISELNMMIAKHVKLRPKTLIVCGSYLIGKERVYFSIAECLGTKVFAPTDKRRIIGALENNVFKKYLTDQEILASVHVMSMQHINPQSLSEYLSSRSSMYNNVIGIKPSGWQFSSSGPGITVKHLYGNTVTLMGVPYSEHSSFSELKEFITSIKPLKVQPTVNVGSATKRQSMMTHIEKWLQK